MVLDKALQFESSRASLQEVPHIEHVSLPPVQNESLFPIAVCCGTPIAGTSRSGTIQHAHLPASLILVMEPWGSSLDEWFNSEFRRVKPKPRRTV